MLRLFLFENLYIVFILLVMREVPEIHLRFLSILLSIFMFNQCLLFIIYYNTFFLNYQFEFSLSSYMNFVIGIGVENVVTYTKVRFGIDALSIFFLIITSLLLPGALLYSKHYLTDQYYVLYVLLLFGTTTLLYLFFSVLNFLIFYICFEFILVPIFLLILFWGPRYKRALAGTYMFLYTFFGSLCFFLLLVFLHLSFRTYDFEQIFISSVIPVESQYMYWCLCFVTFAVKVPMLPVHLWLPEAHVEAPTVGSVYLASLLLKLGGYGLIRLTYQWLPAALLSDLRFIAQIIMICSFLYCSMLIFAQVDLKKIIAYSSIIHMNFGLLGLMSNTTSGVIGCIYMLLGHSLVSGALFYLVGMLYDRTKSRFIHDYSMLSLFIPIWSFFFLFFSLCNAGFPGTVNFIGELLISVGVISNATKLGLSIFNVIILVGLFFSIIFSLLLVNRTIYGGVVKGTNMRTLLSDLTIQEVLVLLPLFIGAIYFGLNGTFIQSYLVVFINKPILYYGFSLLVFPFFPLLDFFFKFYERTGEYFGIVHSASLEKIALYLKYSSLLKFTQLIDIVGLDATKLSVGLNNLVGTKNINFYLASLSLMLSTVFNTRVTLLSWFTIPVLPSLETVYWNATWAERENWDMFGLLYTTKDLRRILTNYGFDGFPLRKAFPLIGIIEFYFNVALGYITDRPTDQSQGFRLYTISDIWLPTFKVQMMPFIFLVLVKEPESTYNYWFIYFTLAMYAAIFICLPYIRNILYSTLAVAFCFLVFVCVLLQLGYEFIATLILILYVGSILLVILYVISVLNNGPAIDQVTYTGYSKERVIFLFCSLKSIFVCQVIFQKSVDMDLKDMSMENFQSCSTTLNDAESLTVFFSLPEYILYTAVISFFLLLTVLLLTLIGSGWRYLKVKSRWH